MALWTSRQEALAVLPSDSPASAKVSHIVKSRLGGRPLCLTEELGVNRSVMGKLTENGALTE